MPLAHVFSNASEVGRGSEFWITAAGSVNGQIPAWSRATRSSFPPVIRGRVRDIEQALHSLGRKVTMVHGPQGATAERTCETLPEDVLDQIVTFCVRDLWADPAIREAVRLGEAECRAEVAALCEVCAGSGVG